MESVGPTVAGAMDRLFEVVKCAKCDADFGRRRGSEDEHCEPCAGKLRIADEVAAVKREMDRHVDAFLRRSGLSTRELTARAIRVPAGLAAALKAGAGTSVFVMRSGEVPRTGFGISGATGSGKSFALAAILREMVETRLAAHVERVGRKALAEQFLSWVAWPEAANRFRRTAARGDGGLDEVEAEVERMSRVPVLVLDDLGAERFRGETYSDDWVASQLDALIDERYNEMRPTWYTTNLALSEFSERYGSRLTSRLVAENPFVLNVPGAADLRLVRRA